MEDVDKKELNERDLCTKFITPAIKQANWKERQIREDVNLTEMPDKYAEDGIETLRT